MLNNYARNTKNESIYILNKQNMKERPKEETPIENVSQMNGLSQWD